MQTKVFAFKCRGPREGVEEVGEQIWLAHRYYNKLIELYRAQRDECEQLRRERCPEFVAAEQAVESANVEVERIIDEIAKANAKERRKTATKEQRQMLIDAKKIRKEAWAKRKEIRAAINADAGLQAALAAVYVKYQGRTKDGSERRVGGLLKEARAACKTYWGTYLKYEAAFESAVKKTIGQPRFARWDGNGQVAVQIQKGATWQDILLGRGRVANLVRAEPLPTTRTGGSARPWLISLCVRTDDKKKPVWAKVKTWLHRDLPDDALVMGVALVRTVNAVHRMKDGLYHQMYEWSMQFTFRTAEQKPHASSGAVGIDLGWRLMDDNTLRVAYWVDDLGRKGELRLPAKLLAKWSKSESLQSIRDLNFDAMRAKLADWKAALPTVPEWLADATKFIGQWRSHGKLVRVINLWRANRIAGDELILAELQAWHDQEAHLWQWQIANQRNARRVRMDLYRNFAAMIRTSYARVAVEDCDWRQLARKPGPAEESQHGATTYMRMASVGLLRSLLKQDGAVMVDAKNTTKTCSQCGSIEEWDQATELTHKCERCGVDMDQDESAARNLLARAKIQREDAIASSRESDNDNGKDVAADAPKAGGKWARRKANRSQKVAKVIGES